MSYKEVINRSIVAIIVGLMCLVLGFMIGRQTPLPPVNGLNSVSAQEIISP